MINLAWGGYSNGKLPQSALVQVTSKPDYLEQSAATAWINMRNACFNATGRWINIAPGSAAYRDYAQQVYFYNLWLNGAGNVAAVPGTSNHGWGRAVDITGYEVYPTVWNWLIANAGNYGYSWNTGQLSGERWHWESLNAPTNPTNPAGGGSTPIEEDDMYNETDRTRDNLVASQVGSILNQVNAIKDALFKTTPISGATTGGSPIAGGDLRMWSIWNDAQFQVEGVGGATRDGAFEFQRKTAAELDAIIAKLNQIVTPTPPTV